MKTITQLKRGLRKANKNSRDLVMMFVDDPIKSNKMWRRSEKAHTAYLRQKEIREAKSVFRTFTQAQKAVLKYRAAIKEQNTYVDQKGGINTPAQMQAFMADPKTRREYIALTVKISKARTRAQLAALAFPKLKF